MILSTELCLLKIYLPHVIKESNKLDSEIRKSETYAFFQKMLQIFIRTTKNSTYKISEPLGKKLLTIL